MSYYFIDGGYIQAEFRRLVVPLDPSLFFSPTNFRESLQWYHQPFRAFYYDCVDPDADAAQEHTRLTALRELRNFHVREGIIQGQGKRRRQKQVDVLLAVDMLEYAARNVFDHAVLMAGDLDFKPVVDALVRLGRHVEVMANPKSCSKQLRWASDGFSPLELHDLVKWADWSACQKDARPDNTGMTLSTFQEFEQVESTPSWEIRRRHEEKGIVRYFLRTDRVPVKPADTFHCLTSTHEVVLRNAAVVLTT